MREIEAAAGESRVAMAGDPRKRSRHSESDAPRTPLACNIEGARVASTRVSGRDRR